MKSRHEHLSLFAIGGVVLLYQVVLLAVGPAELVCLMAGGQEGGLLGVPTSQVSVSMHSACNEKHHDHHSHVASQVSVSIDSACKEKQA